MTTWVRDFYDTIDGMKLEEFLEWQTDDAKVTFGNNPTAEGKEQIAEAIGGFWSMIGGLTHNFVNVWETGDGTTVLEAAIDYATKGGAEVTVPAVTLIERSGEKVSDLRIHVDLAPLFEAMGQEG